MFHIQKLSSGMPCRYDITTGIEIFGMITHGKCECCELLRLEWRISGGPGRFLNFGSTWAIAVEIEGGEGGAAFVEEDGRDLEMWAPNAEV